MSIRRAALVLLVLSAVFTTTLRHPARTVASQAAPADLLRMREFAFETGAAVHAALTDARVRVVFGQPGADGLIPASVIAEGRVDGRPLLRADGSFDPIECRLAVDKLTFDETARVEFETSGRDFLSAQQRRWAQDLHAAFAAPIDYSTCAFDSGSQSLLLGRDGETASSSAARDVYNFVVVLTDDQRFDTLWAMPIVRDRIGGAGVTFSRAYGTVSLCCPWRASFLGGGFYASETGVLSNQYPNGSSANFVDTNTLATRLYARGYRNGLFGKYLNGYSRVAPTIPPGWNRFVGHVAGTAMPTETWSDFFVATGASDFGETQGRIAKIDQYTVDFFGGEALDFMRASNGTPFFVYLTTRAPHIPATPPSEDRDAFADYQYRGRGYGESDVTDKPEWIQNMIAQRWPLADGVDVAERPNTRPWSPARALASLQSVDRLVGALVDEVERLGVDDRTVFVFTSDGGENWGEHQLWGKVYHYEESLRVPLVIAYPGGSAARFDGLVANNLDVAATMLDIAGVNNGTSGVSLLPLLRGEEFEGRPFIYSETFWETDSPDRHAVAITTDDEHGTWKYIEHYAGAVELYDLGADPFETESLHDSPAHAETRARLAALLDSQKAVGFTTFSPPTGTVGVPYSFDLEATGGQRPYRFGFYDGGRFSARVLPPGLALDPDSGLISGTPTESGRFQVMLAVKDASVSPQSGRPQHHFMWFVFVIEPGRD